MCMDNDDVGGSEDEMECFKYFCPADWTNKSLQLFLVKK